MLDIGYHFDDGWLARIYIRSIQPVNFSGSLHRMKEGYSLACNLRRSTGILLIKSYHTGVEMMKRTAIRNSRPDKVLKLQVKYAIIRWVGRRKYRKPASQEIK